MKLYLQDIVLINKLRRFSKSKLIENFLCLYKDYESVGSHLMSILKNNNGEIIYKIPDIDNNSHYVKAEKIDNQHLKVMLIQYEKTIQEVGFGQLINSMFSN